MGSADQNSSDCCVPLAKRIRCHKISLVKICGVAPSPAQDLTGADFSQADLRGADFRRATLIDANFSQAKVGLLPFRPQHAMARTALIWVALAATIIVGSTVSNPLIINTRFLSTNLGVPGIVLVAALTAWFVIKGRLFHRSQRILMAGIITSIGVISVAVMTRVAQDALTAVVSVEIIWTLIGCWIAILIFDRPIKQPQVWRQLGFILLVITIFIVLFMPFSFTRKFVIIGYIFFMPAVGYIAVTEYILSIVRLALAFDRTSFSGWIWALIMFGTLCWNLGLVWLWGNEGSLWVPIVPVIIIITVVSLLGPIVVRQLMTAEHPFSSILSLTEIVQGTTDFEDANLTNANLDSRGLEHTNLKTAILKDTRFENNSTLEETRYLHDIMHGHPGLKELFRTQHAHKPPQRKRFESSLSVFLGIGLILVPLLLNYFLGKGFSFPEVVQNVRGSTHLQQVLDGAADDITDLVFSPNGELLISAARNGTVKLQDLKTGRSRDIDTDHSGALVALAISADGQVLASGSERVKLWDPGTGKLLRTVPKQLGLTMIDINGHNFAALNLEHTLQLRSVPTESSLQALPIASPSDNTVLSPRGIHLIVPQDKTTDIWDLTTGQRLHQLTAKRPHDELQHLAISSDEQTLVKVYDDGQSLRDRNQRRSVIEVWDLTTGDLRQTYPVHGWFEVITVSPDGNVLAGVNADNDQINVWNLQTGQQLQVLPEVMFSVENMAISPDGQLLAISSAYQDSDNIVLWQLVAESASPLH